jgi:TRAP-type uncharacterized transport system fused permease subunit
MRFGSDRRAETAVRNRAKQISTLFERYGLVTSLVSEISGFAVLRMGEEPWEGVASSGLRWMVQAAGSSVANGCTIVIPTKEH